MRRLSVLLIALAAGTAWAANDGSTEGKAKELSLSTSLKSTPVTLVREITKDKYGIVHTNFVRYFKMKLTKGKAYTVYLDDPKGSPIYISQRIGQDGRLFKFYKLRSMCVGADQELEKLLSQNEMDGPVFKIRKDPRITRIGRFIRKCSIDELPQFYNVLKGDMSIVGPRPAIPREVAQYTEYQRQRLYVKPGLTCYWQVTPRRNDLSFDEWVQLDLAYIRDRNFLLDWKLIFRTVRVMLMGEGE